jgi:uncharacterized protein YndB with AHSA1/START domain
MTDTSSATVATEPAADERDVVVTREFDAPREVVWRAWTEPEHFTRWWGPHGFTTPVCEMDLRPGGAYRIVMRGPDGTELPHWGEFLEVAPPERLVFTQDLAGQQLPEEWYDRAFPGREPGVPPALTNVTTVTFRDLGGGTRLEIRSRWDSRAIRDALAGIGIYQGWGESLERLDALVAGMNR